MSIELKDKILKKFEDKPFYFAELCLWEDFQERVEFINQKLNFDYKKDSILETLFEIVGYIKEADLADFAFHLGNNFYYEALSLINERFLYSSKHCDLQKESCLKTFSSKKSRELLTEEFSSHDFIAHCWNINRDDCRKYDTKKLLFFNPKIASFFDQVQLVLRAKLSATLLRFGTMLFNEAKEACENQEEFPLRMCLPQGVNSSCRIWLFRTPLGELFFQSKSIKKSFVCRHSTFYYANVSEEDFLYVTELLGERKMISEEE